MKTYLLTFCCLVSSTLYGASTTAKPFEFEFFVPKNRMVVAATLVQSCRFEKIVWSDSSEYIVNSKSYPLSIEVTSYQGEESYKLISSEERFLELRGMFRPTKECKSELHVDFTDKNYAVGWAGQMDRPLKFHTSTEHYYQEGDHEFNPSSVLDLLENKTIDFYYMPAVFQVNIWLTANGRKLPNAPISSALNPKTNMPYLLRQKY
jgi:hypothetical protein